MNNTVPPKVYEFLNKVVKDDINNYLVSVHAPNKKGAGFLGDMWFVSLQDKNSEKILNYVVKQAFDHESTRTTFPINDIYMNEIYFYTEIWPTFLQLQNIIPPSKAFKSIPKCLGTTSDEKFESIIMENLKFEKFELYNRKKAFDEDHIKLILKEYGKFHALSFAYRVVNPDKYSELSRGLKDIYRQLVDVKPFRRRVQEIQELCLESLHPGEDDKVIIKYKHYIESGMDIFANSNKYEGKYSVILHGDCWSNNMMFKYDENGKPTDMRLLDFQLSGDGNPACDLSHILYSGAPKEVLNDLDYYLKVYYNSLSEILKLFNLNPDVIYPFKVLKNDWKHYCRRGFTMGLLTWKSKSTSEDDILDSNDFKENPEDVHEIFVDTKYDETNFNKRTRDLILHMYNNDFL